jgi:hypothetical protein
LASSSSPARSRMEVVVIEQHRAARAGLSRYLGLSASIST